MPVTALRFYLKPERQYCNLGGTAGSEILSCSSYIVIGRTAFLYALNGG